MLSRTLQAAPTPEFSKVCPAYQPNDTQGMTGGRAAPQTPAQIYTYPRVTLAHGGGNTVPKGFYLTLSRTFQAAQIPEKSKVFCFFSSEKKTFLPYLQRQMDTAFRISAGLNRIKRGTGQILSAAFICLRAKPAQLHGNWTWSGSPGGDPPGLDWVTGPTRLPFWLEPGLLRC